MVAASGWRYWPRSPRLPPPLPLDGPGPSLDRRAAMDGGLGCRVGRGFELFFCWSRRYGSDRKPLKKNKNNDGHVCLRCWGVCGWSCFGPRRQQLAVPEPIVGGSAIQLSGSRQLPPIMAGARRWTVDSGVGQRGQRVADGRGLQTAHWAQRALTARPLDAHWTARFQAPRQGSTAVPSPGQGTLASLGRLG